MATDCEVFLSFKKADRRRPARKGRKPAGDSVLAREVYDYLSGRGLTVFNCDVSLEKLGESGFQKAIDAALDQARVVVVVATTLSNLNSQWVGDEWGSFLNDMRSRRKPDGHLYSYVTGIDPGDLPRGLRERECIHHTGPDSLETLHNFIVHSRGKAQEPSVDGLEAGPLRRAPARIPYAPLALVCAAIAIAALAIFVWGLNPLQPQPGCTIAITSPTNDTAAPLANDVDAPGNFVAISGRTSGCPSDRIILLTAQWISDPPSPELPQFAGAPVRPSADGSWSAYVHVGGPDAQPRFRVRAYSIGEQTFQQIKNSRALPAEMTQANAEVAFTIASPPGDKSE